MVDHRSDNDEWIVVPVPLNGGVHPLGVEGDIIPRPVSFRPDDPACLSRTDNGLLVFRTLVPSNVIAAHVVVDGGNAGGTHRVDGFPMRVIGVAGCVSLWECVLDPPTPNLSYTLAYEFDNGTVAYWGATGLTTGVERLERFETTVADVTCHDVPDWARGMVLYQIFPDRFAIGDESLTPADVEPWEAPPTRTGFKGGDLVGIRKQLDYLTDLGIDAVYLNPIFTSPSNHKYDCADYYEVDAAFGGTEALDELVAEAHGRGIRVILDVSLNHAHPSFEPFADVMANGPGSEYAGWFVVNDYPPRIRVRSPENSTVHSVHWTEQLPRIREETDLIVEEVDDPGPAVEPTYEAWFGVPTMPRIELQDPRARQAMIDVATHWLDRHHVDGWRMDVVRYIDPDFWVDVRREVRRVRADAYLLAEVMGDSQQWLQGDMFDATMNYSFRQLCLDYFATDVIDTEQLLEGLLRLLAMYSPPVAAVNHNLLGSHDTERFLTLAGGDTNRLLLATALQLTFPGAPGLYYGDEIAMEGGPDPDNRRAFEWDKVGSEHHAAVRSLVRLRRVRPELRHGDFKLIAGTQLVFERRLGDDAAVIAINHTEHRLAVVAGKVLWSAGVLRESDGLVALAPGGAVVAEVRD